MFRRGDKVYDMMRRKWGIVTEIDNYKKTPVHVVFAHNEPTYCYTADGRLGDDTEIRRLYFREFDIYLSVPDEAFLRPRWRADCGRIYYYVSACGEVATAYDCREEKDDKLYASGNYFINDNDVKESEIYKAFTKEEKDV